MPARKRAAWKGYAAIAIGTFAMIQWHLNEEIINDTFKTVISPDILFYVVPALVSMGVFLISFDLMPVIAVDLIFLFYELMTGRITDNYMVYDYILPFMVSIAILWLFKKLLSF